MRGGFTLLLLLLLLRSLNIGTVTSEKRNFLYGPTDELLLRVTIGH